MSERAFVTKEGHVVASSGELAWQVRAACRGPQAMIFFPPAHVERKDERLAREGSAKAICHDCPVEDDCLEYAIRIREPHGIWGGRNESERRQMIDRLPTLSSSPGSGNMRLHA